MRNNKSNNGECVTIDLPLVEEAGSRDSGREDKPSGKFSGIVFSIHGSAFDPSPLSRPSTSPLRRHSPGHWVGARWGSHTSYQHSQKHWPHTELDRKDSHSKFEWPSFHEQPSFVPGHGPAPKQRHHVAGVTTGLLKNSQQIIHTNLFKGANGFNY